MLRFFRINTSLLLLPALLVSETSAQQTSSPRNLGTLRCTIAPGVAVIVDSPKDLRCMFYKSDGTQEAYRGEVRGGGLNVGITGRTFAAWGVTGDVGLIPPASLSGRYSGVEAGVTVGVGATGRSLANQSKTLSLQPLDVGPQSGLNIALGIAQVDLFALGAPQLPASSEPVPLVPERSSPTPAPQPELAPAPPRTPDYVCADETRLEPAQTLSGLARACRVSLAALLEANPRISNVRTIQAGTLIRIPQQSRSRTGQCGTRTLVNQGETLADVASRCGISLDALSIANPDLASTPTIPEGQVLAVPPPGEAAEPTEMVDAAPVEEAKEPEPPATAPVAEIPEQTDDEPQAEADTPLLPALDQQETLETEQLQQQEAASEFAEFEDRCRQVAAMQYGLPDDQITTTSTAEAENSGYTVVMDLGTREVTCLVDQQGQVLSLTDSQTPSNLGNIDDATYQLIRSRLPDDEALLMIAISDEAALSQTARIEGYRSTAYGFKASASEALEITFETDNTNAHFNVVSAETPYGEALFVGMKEGRNRTVVSFPKDGFYLVRPYLTLPAARQNETATYTLRISRTAPLPAIPAGKTDRRSLAPSGKSDPLVPLN